MNFLAIFQISCIFLCFLYVLTQKNRDFLLKIAFLFTFVSDLFLAKNHTAPIGVLTFTFAQLAHFARLCKNPHFLKLYLISASAALIFGTLFGEKLFTTPLFVYAGVYAVTEIINFILAISFNKRTAIGFALFLACDLCILIGFFMPTLTHYTDYICWVFYLPSQILLAISAAPVVKSEYHGR